MIGLERQKVAFFYAFVTSSLPTPVSYNFIKNTN